MENTLLNTLLVHFAGLCQQVGLDASAVILSLAGAAATAITGGGTWLAAKLAKKTASLAWRGTKGVWNWATYKAPPPPEPEPGQTCKAVLAALDDPRAEWVDVQDAQGSKRRMLRVPGKVDVWFCRSDGEGDLAGVKVYRKDRPSLDVLPVLEWFEVLLVEKAAWAVIEHIERRLADYTRMEIVHALTPKQDAHNGTLVGSDGQPWRVTG